ncbi:hypothetical protein B0T14DRAFT_563858 [Immersiella caudata]|uniref:Uncharacterized protein n=1 Tax=Immersiella caudata TaxID=314043 RepID=A0AA39WVM1_9PEZI|nr:hypothetical protein B0T14DRAFT_563858 [Immersiella caudata]
MHLLSLPTELRLPIYAELLVLDRPITLGTGQYYPDPRYLWTRTKGLDTGILRVNKQINREAMPFLYSNNRFAFRDMPTMENNDYDSEAEAPCIAAFLRQIKANASLLRHIRMDMKSCLAVPIWTAPEGELVLAQQWIELLGLLKAACPHLSTVEMLSEALNGIFMLDEPDMVVSLLQLLHEGAFKDMTSLEKVVVVHEMPHLCEEALADRETLMGMLPSSVWDIQLTKVPAETWVSQDGRIEFETEEECRAYDDAWWRSEMEREERREEEEWLEEYYHRRADPCWKNDSDYD